MKYILNYKTQQEVEQKESISSVSAEYGHEIIVRDEGDDIFKINGDTFIAMKGRWSTYMINKDNTIPKQDTRIQDSSFDVYAQQPVYFHEQPGDDGFPTFIKFERTRNEGVLVYYSTGGGQYSSMYAAEGRLTLEDGTAYERAYIMYAGDSSLCINLVDHEEDGKIYVRYCGEFYWLPAGSLEIEGYKVSSITPGVGYCKENRNVIYNDTWKGVTLYVEGGAEKTYKTNYVTIEQIINDLGAHSGAYIRQNEWEMNDFIRMYDGYAFMKSSSGKRYEVAWKE